MIFQSSARDQLSMYSMSIFIQVSKSTASRPLMAHRHIGPHHGKKQHFGFVKHDAGREPNPREAAMFAIPKTPRHPARTRGRGAAGA